MTFKDFVKRSMARDPRFKQLQEERKMHNMVEEREKGANERELERFYEEERQKSIKKNLDEFREMRKREMWDGKHNQILKAKDIFKGHKSVLHQDFEILGGKKLFMDKGNKTKGKNLHMNPSKIKKGGCGFIR